MPSPWFTVSEERQRAEEMQVQLSTPIMGRGVGGGVGVVIADDGPVGWGRAVTVVFTTGCVVGGLVRMFDSMEEMVDVVANGVGLRFDKHKK